jgi:hypothetical protein
MRVVLDPNVLISALLSPSGAPAQLVRAWRAGALDLVMSPALLDELARALDYPKILNRVPPPEAELWLRLLGDEALVIHDPEEPPPVSCSDPDDDYLISLASAARAVLVSGDTALLALADRIPVRSPAEALSLLS